MLRISKQVWSTNRCVLSTFFQLNTFFSEFENNWLPTDGPTDGRTDGPTDGRTDGRTDPLIEMLGRIQKYKYFATYLALRISKHQNLYDRWKVL